MTYDQQDLLAALDTLRRGGVILYPTDTVWGLGCDARNAQAVDRIYSIKQRQDSKAMLVLLDTPAKLQGYVHTIPDMAWQLIEYSQKPMTIIYPNAYNVAPKLIAQDGSLGIRITRDIFCQQLIARLRAPLVSTSANISGMPPATTFNTIDKHIMEQVDYVVQHRRRDTTQAQPSSIIKLEVNNEFKLIR